MRRTSRHRRAPLPYDSNAAANVPMASRINVAAAVWSGMCAERFNLNCLDTNVGTIVHSQLRSRQRPDHMGWNLNCLSRTLWNEVPSNRRDPRWRVINDLYLTATSHLPHRLPQPAIDICTEQLNADPSGRVCVLRYYVEDAGSTLAREEP